MTRKSIRKRLNRRGYFDIGLALDPVKAELIAFERRDHSYDRRYRRAA